MKRILFFIIITLSCSLFSSDMKINNPDDGKEIKSYFFARDNLFAQKSISSNLYFSFIEDEVQYGIAKTTKLQPSISNIKASFYNFFRKGDSQLTDILHHQYKDMKFAWKVDTGLDLHLKEEQKYYYWYKGIKLNSNIGKNLRLNAYWTAGHFKGDEEFFRQSPLLKGWIKRMTDENLYLDELQAEIVYHKKYGNLFLGRGNHEIGNNIGGSIILSNVSDNYGYAGFNLLLGKFRLDFIHADVLPDSTQSFAGTTFSNDKFAEKYFVIHQLSYQITNKIQIFFGESIIYGSRPVDISYLLPHTFYRVTEHNLHNRDNALIFGRFEVNHHNHLFYMNGILDELRKSEIFGNWWGNKYAFQTGYSYQRKIHSRTHLRNAFSSSYEVTAVRPWIYTHNTLVNKYSNYRHPLGFPNGTNLVQFSTRQTLRFMRDFSTALQVDYLIQGSHANSFAYNYMTIEDLDNTEAEWLQGDISRTIFTKLILQYDYSYHHRIRLGFNIEKPLDDDAVVETIVSYSARF